MLKNDLLPKFGPRQQKFDDSTTIAIEIIITTFDYDSLQLISKVSM
jgi:hypothetical protein